MNCGNALAVKYKAFFGRGHDQVWLDDIECTGHEKSLAECPHRGFGEHDCDHSEDAGVICSGNKCFTLFEGKNVQVHTSLKRFFEIYFIFQRP